VTTHNADLNDEQFRANRFEMVSRLADDLAHEIRNPLNAIVINLEVLRARVRRGDAGAALERADVIEAEARRLHQLVDRLLQLLRPDREDAASLALDQALDELLPLIEAQVRLARNEFTADCAAALFVAVRRDVLKFALLNVMTAVHERLGEAGGEFRFECVARSDHIRLSVRDVHRVGGGRDGRAVAHAAALAAALLAPGGGTVSADDAGVIIVLPRAASI
jgi:signal transduction histidine kinase